MIMEYDNRKKNKKKKKINKANWYEDLEDIVGIKEIKAAFYYSKPENKNNKLFDSLFIIIDINEYYIFALQITK